MPIPHWVAKLGASWAWGHFDMNHQSLSSFIWSVADLLRGDYKQSDYGKVILPFTVLRRLDCVLEATKPKVLTEFAAKTKQKLIPIRFCSAPPVRASTTHRLHLGKLMGDQDHIRENLFAYVQAFSPATRVFLSRLISQYRRWLTEFRNNQTTFSWSLCSRIIGCGNTRPLGTLSI